MTLCFRYFLFLSVRVRVWTLAGVIRKSRKYESSCLAPRAPSIFHRVDQETMK